MAFQTRKDRLDLSFPVEFFVDGECVRGHCLNLSESGLLATFDPLLDLWTAEDIHLLTPEGTCTERARVARVQERAAKLSFCFRGEGERLRVREVLALASERTLLVGTPPF